MANPNKPDQPRTENPTGKPLNPNPQTGKPVGNTQSSGQGNYSFRCADAGFKECSWETKGSNPDEVLHQAEEHGREQHNLTNIDDELRNKVRSNIHRAA